MSLLNAARRWWLDNMPWTGRIPTDDEVLKAYVSPELAASIREGIAEAERGDTIDRGSFARYDDGAR